MRKKELKLYIYDHDSLFDLPESEKNLVLEARSASENAYAPYSNFKVGAAVLLEDGTVVRGNNQENADFTDGMCAERVSLFYANSQFPDKKVIAMAVSARGRNGLTSSPAMPCGSCRQALVETSGRYNHSIKIILDGSKYIRVVEDANNLLPFAFKPDSLD